MSMRPGTSRTASSWWTWCFRAGLYTLFKIDPTRSADVLIDVLGAEFDGVLGCDYFSAYRRYHRECGVVLQFCLAHLIRDVKYLTTLPDARDRAYGERLIGGLRALFGVIHRRDGVVGRGLSTPLGGGAGRGVAAGDAGRAGDAGQWQPGEAVRGAWGELFPVHHDARGRADEQPGGAGDPVRGDRPAITQGTRSERGDRWCERIWTVMATCSQQGRSVFAYLEAAVAAWFGGEEAPSLLPRES